MIGAGGAGSTSRDDVFDSLFRKAEITPDSSGGENITS